MCMIYLNGHVCVNDCIRFDNCPKVSHGSKMFPWKNGWKNGLEAHKSQRNELAGKAKFAGRNKHKNSALIRNL